MKRLLLFLIGLGCFALPIATLAADPPTDAQLAERCQQEIVTQLSSAERLYRIILFGQKPASREPNGASRYDKADVAWIKVATNQWKSQDDSAKDKTLNDDQMEAQSERLSRSGIFETTRVQTSELLPSILQDYRALDCSTAAICQNATLGKDAADAIKDDDGFLEIPTLGCDPVKAKPFPSCQALQERGGTDARAVVQNFCTPVATDMTDREGDLLKLAVTYDAAYRSLLQFSGIFDGFLAQFKGDILTPIEQASSLVGLLSHTPCFIAECNE